MAQPTATIQLVGIPHLKSQSRVLLPGMAWHCRVGSKPLLQDTSLPITEAGEGQISGYLATSQWNHDCRLEPTVPG